MESVYFNRDLSWLSFNGRVMEEAANEMAPLLERIRFLSIFSSNLDEFYRVRMPVLHALKKIGEDEKSPIDPEEQATTLQTAKSTINEQQTRFGEILNTQLIPSLKENNIYLLYNEAFPDFVQEASLEYFTSNVLAFLQPVYLDEDDSFFPQNNKLYFVITLADTSGKERVALLNIPSDEMPRFFSIKAEGTTYIAFLDDVVRYNLDKVFKHYEVKETYAIKITRDAELDLKDEYPGALSEEIETQLKKRDLGFATRFLHQSGMSLRILQTLINQFEFSNANITQGGRYHNLKDFYSLPVSDTTLYYNPWPPLKNELLNNSAPLAKLIDEMDLIIHTPYQSYDAVLRFFNEAAINPDVEEIFTTLYRVASNSLIVHALISAAKNGKTVTVVVELKARFDEANNLKWAKAMKEAGVKIIYSITALKVHAKVALVKTRKANRVNYTGLLATGNFNESTARFYTDHILLTANHAFLREIELLFIFLSKQEKPSPDLNIQFEHLLVAGFNLQTGFLMLIDNEIALAKKGLPASIVIKVNNLEERTMINKLYEASQAGVKVLLIVRSICCLVPGVAGLSENITVRRIVDRYLEHGRIFIFNNNGDEKIYLGSADWMNRNIHHRVEVCFPVYDPGIKQQLIEIVNAQLADNAQAVMLDKDLRNVPVTKGDPAVEAQLEIYKLLQKQNNGQPFK